MRLVGKKMNPEEISKQIQDEVTKAVTGATYTMDPPARSIYAPENLDPVIKLLVPTATPVRNILPRVPGMGQAAGWNAITSKLDPGAGSLGSSVGFADAGQPAQTTITTAFTTAAYKNLGRDVEIGRQAIAANRGSNLEDMQASQETIKTMEVLLGEENMILNGDAAADADEFSGFAKLFTTNSGSAALLTVSGIGVYATTLWNAGAEMVSHLVLNSRQNRALSDQLEGTGSINRIVIDDQGRAVGGQRLAKIVDPNTGNLIDVVTSRYTAAWAYLLTASSPAGENWLEMEDLEKLSIYDVPTANHAIQSRVFETTVLKVIGEVFQYKIGGLATS